MRDLVKKLRTQLEKLVRKELLWLAIILIGAFVVRLYKINNPLADWHSWRQADTASVSRTYLQEGIDLLFPRYHDISSIQTGYSNTRGYRFVEFPLYNAAHTLFAEFTKSFSGLSFEASGRMVSIIASLISICLLYLIGKRFISPLGGLLTAFFFAFIPYNIYFTRVILPEPFATTLGLASIWAFIKYYDKDKIFFFYLSSALLAVSMLVKPYTVFYIVPLVYLYFEKHSFEGVLNNAKLVIKALVFANILLVPFFAWRIWIDMRPEGIPFFEWAFNGDMIRFRPAFWRWIFGERLGRLILGIWGLLPFSLGLLTKVKKTYFNHFFLLGMFFYVTLFATASVRHDYYQIFAIPAIALIMAQGSHFLLTSKELKKWLAIPVLTFSVVMMMGIGFYQTKEYYKINHPEIIEAGQAIDKIAPKDAWVIAPYNGDTAFLYQTNRWGWPAIDDSVENIIKKGADYYVSVDLESNDSIMISNKYATIERTSSYIIIDLHQPIE